MMDLDNCGISMIGLDIFEIVLVLHAEHPNNKDFLNL